MLNLEEIQNTLVEKKINVFHIFVGILFASLPSLITGKRFTNEELVNWLYILGIVIIIVHTLIILKYYYNKTQVFAEEYKTDYQDLFLAKVQNSRTKDIFRQEFLTTEIRTTIYNDSRYKPILDSYGFTSDWL